MKILRPIEKGYNKVIKVLTKIYGFEADIYSPISVNNLKHGHRDSDINYEIEPSYSGKILIPSLLRTKNSEGMFIEDYEGSGTWMWLTNYVSIPELSKVVLRNSNLDILNFQVLRYRHATDNEMKIYGKYELVPLNNIDIIANKDEIIGRMEEQDELDSELSEEELASLDKLQDNLIVLEDSEDFENALEEVDTVNEKVPSIRVYQPIGD